MADTGFDQFLQEATTFDPDSDASLEPDHLFGLYTSWCHITQTPPRNERSFRRP